MWSNIFSIMYSHAERRRREAMLGGFGGMLNRISFRKKVQFCAFWCILGPILVFIALLFLRLNFNVAFADKSEKRILNVI